MDQTTHYVLNTNKHVAGPRDLKTLWIYTCQKRLLYFLHIL